VPFEFIPTGIPDVVRIIPRRFSDDRGWFAETYKRTDFVAAGIKAEFVQDNHSVSAIGTVRGLHYQLPPHGQCKLVRVVRGRAWDVAVDIRRTSPTFGRSIALELSDQNGEMVWIPEGFAHGFLALEDDTHLTYKCTHEYHQESERAIRWDDRELGIQWPALPDSCDYQLSEKDAKAPSLSQAGVFP